MWVEKNLMCTPIEEKRNIMQRVLIESTEKKYSYMKLGCSSVGMMSTKKLIVNAL